MIIIWKHIDYWEEKNNPMKIWLSSKKYFNGRTHVRGWRTRRRAWPEKGGVGSRTAVEGNRSPAAAIERVQPPQALSKHSPFQTHQFLPFPPDDYNPSVVAWWIEVKCQETECEKCMEQVRRRECVWNDFCL